MTAVQQSPTDQHEIEITEPDQTLESPAKTANADESTTTIASSSTNEPEQEFNFGNTLLLFDWDDTILPTTHLQVSGYRLDGPNPPPQMEVMLQALADDVSKTMFQAKDYGHIVIVTNAENGWVELTTQKFFSNIADSISGVEVISARSTYEPTGVTDPSEWKRLAFSSIIENFYVHKKGPGRLNVISLGDSSHEREAVLHVTRNLRENQNMEIVTKSLKLMERPDVYHMHKQHDILRSCMREIVYHDNNLDLCIQVQAPDDPSDTLPTVLQKGSNNNQQQQQQQQTETNSTASSDSNNSSESKTDEEVTTEEATQENDVKMDE